MDNKKIIKRIIAAVLLIAIIFSLGYCMRVARYKMAIKAITFKEVDLSQIPDGEYVGSYDVGFISATVHVDVKEGRIENIDLVKHKNEKGKAAEAIVGDIVQQQKIDVDAISGATNSSKVIKKAVENALESSTGGVVQ